MTLPFHERWPIVTNWKFFVVILLPFVLCPLLFIQDDDVVYPGTDAERPATKFKCAYVIILMAIYWMTEAIPLAITALLPIVFFPLLGVQDTGKVSINYMRETNMMFLGGLIIALAVEFSNLHKRVALFIMTLVGTSPVRLMLGIMMTTMLLSMWISNTATTAMMVPIVLAVLDELSKDADAENLKHNDINGGTTPRLQVTNGNFEDEEKYGSIEPPRKNEYDEKFSDGSLDLAIEQVEDLERIALQKQLLIAVTCGANIGGLFWPYTSVTSSVLYRHVKRFGKGILLSMAYASNIGGTGFLTGTAANVILKSRAHDVNVGQDGKYTDLTFATWMAFNIPGMLINTLIAWMYLTLVFFGPPSWLRFGKGQRSGQMVGNAKGRDNAKRFLKQKYAELGPMTFHEKWVGGLFLCVVCLWLFRDPKFIKGWAEFIQHVDVGDSTAAMFIVLLLFIIPRSLNYFKGGAPGSLLEWKYVQDNLPWGIILLMGGGFALSDAAEASGLGPWIGQQLNGLAALNESLILIVVMIATAFLTEIASNTAVANVIIPILLALSKNIGVHPLYLTLPATVTCSYAFMLPVATPPNAIVFGASKNMQILDMAKSGIFLNFSCVIVLFLLNITYGNYLFDYSNYIYPNATSVL